MRIALTALTPKGPADVIVSGDDGATAGQVAEALQEAFAPKEHLASVILHPPGAHRSPADGGRAYHRPPRFRPDLKPVKIEVPAEPKKGHGNGVALLLSAAVPVVMGGVMVYVTKQWLYSLFMLMMPVMVLGT